MAKPLAAPAGGDGVVATGRSPPTISATRSQQRPTVASGDTTSETRRGLGRDVGLTAPPAQHVQVAPAAGARPIVWFNPGPTVRKARGRKKKVLLDTSEVTKDGVVGAEELEALLKDATLQQVSS